MEDEESTHNMTSASSEGNVAEDHQNTSRDNAIIASESARSLRSPNDSGVLDTDQEVSAASPRPLNPPQRVEPTLKEKLVERERQRRVETERARLKRQFALQSNGGGLMYDSATASGGALRENGSVAGTVGEESSVGVVHSELEDDLNNSSQEPQLGYTMERFLQGSGGPPRDAMPSGVAGITVMERTEEEESEATDKGVLMERFLNQHVETVAASIPQEPRLEQENEDSDKGVVMERFLNEPVVVAASNTAATPRDPPAVDDVDRSVSFDVQGSSSLGLPLHREDGAVSDELNQNLSSPVAGILPEYPVASASVELDSEDADIGQVSINSIRSLDVEQTTYSQHVPSINSESSIDRQSFPQSFPPPIDADEPRVLGLTEAEIQEMAAIEGASIGNAPPSERSNVSLVGELLDDFGRNAVDPPGTFSQGTRTTAQESASSLSHNNTNQPSSVNEPISDHHTLDENLSVSSHLIVSPGASVLASDGSVSANPPSVIQDVEPASLLLDEVEDMNQPGLIDEGNNIQISDLEGSNPPSIPPVATMPTRNDGEESSSGSLENIVNRTLRPGNVKKPPPTSLESVPHGKSSASPITESQQAVVTTVDGFDFDKHNATMSPRSLLSDSLRDLPGDDTSWANGQMAVSPINSRALLRPPTVLDLPEGHKDQDQAEIPMPKMPTLMPGSPSTQSKKASIGDVPPEIITKAQDQSNGRKEMKESQPSLTTAIGRLVNTEKLETETSTPPARERPSDSSIGKNLERFFPDRMAALLMIILIEIPVVMTISGGGDSLCAALGRRKYHLTMGFLPLVCGVAGNIALQMKSSLVVGVGKESYLRWCLMEFCASVVFGGVAAALVGMVAFLASQRDLSFAIMIFAAQVFSSIVAAAIGGAFPLAYRSILKRDSLAHGDPIETALADLIGSFSVVMLSYQLILLQGPREISQDDLCWSA